MIADLENMGKLNLKSELSHEISSQIFLIRNCRFI